MSAIVAADVRRRALERFQFGQLPLLAFGKWSEGRFGFSNCVHDGKIANRLVVGKVCVSDPTRKTTRFCGCKKIRRCCHHQRQQLCEAANATGTENHLARLRDLRCRVAKNPERELSESFCAGWMPVMNWLKSARLKEKSQRDFVLQPKVAPATLGYDAKELKNLNEVSSGFRRDTGGRNRVAVEICFSPYPKVGASAPTLGWRLESLWDSQGP